MPTDSTIEVLAYRLARAEAEIQENRRKAEAEIQQLHAELDRKSAEEKARLLWGIGVLGAAVMSLFGVIWNWRSVIFSGGN